MAQKVFLVEMTVTIPVVASDEEAAIDVVLDDREVLQAVMDQVSIDLDDGDPSELQFATRELVAEDLAGIDEEWASVVPFGDELDDTIEDRLIHRVGEADEDDQWREPQHPED